MRKVICGFALIALIGIAAGLSSLWTPAANAQATVGTGGIQGVILDPKGATVSSAKVTVTSKDTSQKFEPQVSPNGEYSIGALIPGTYQVRVEASGFKTVERTVVVQVGQIANGNVALELGESSTTVNVEETAAAVNTEQATVSGVLTTQQIENLPINGRNFLDLAQLEPGVQIQDGNNFDPTKVGYSSISFGGRFGRTARIEVDGVDVSDETVGTTTTNIPASALQEFQLSQSSRDLSNELTSSGSVNTVTRSGTNNFHGQAFGLFRDSSMAAALPHPAGIGAPFQREQFGGNLGGPIIKDKFFFFLDAERTKQDLAAPVLVASPLNAFSGTFSSPYRETNLLGRGDFVVTQNLKLFYRFSYFNNAAASTFGAASFQPFKNKDYTRTHVLGADYTLGSWTHSFRFEYLKFQNQIVDDVLGTGLPFADFPVSINVGSFATGPNLLAPQTTPQSDHQVKYDGTKVLGAHILRFGVAYNHLQGGGFAKFFSITPQVFDFQDPAAVAFASASPFAPGGASNPLNYPVELAFIGNGQGFSTENPAFGFPAGGLGPDNRFAAYIGDSWKIRSNVTITAGLRYVRDTGRTDSDLPALAAVNAAYPGLGDRVKQPNLDFAPQLGMAWDPTKSGKMAVRAGIGLYYENIIWNNVLFDRPLRLPSGAFLSFPTPCVGEATPAPVPFANGQLVNPPVGACADSAGNPVSIGAAAPVLAAFQQQFQQVAASVGKGAANPNYLPTLIANGSPLPTGFFDPNFKTPRSVQMNAGVQRQLWKGAVVSADYLRNVATHYGLGVDTNHVGDVRFFDPAAAAAAIDATNSSFGCPLGTAGVTCAMGKGATMANYAANGLGTPADAGIGACTATAELNAGLITDPSQAFRCAFGGINPDNPAFIVQKPIGRSTYDALQVKFIQNVANPVRGIRGANFQISYALGSFQNAGGASSTSPGTPGSGDQDFVIPALDNANPLRYFGWGPLDRRHQLSFGGTAELPGGFRTGIVAHFYSSLPLGLYVPNTGAGPGEIFRTDFTGDGTVQDPLPNSRVGSFGRNINAGGLGSTLNNYNSTFGDQATPAGQLLINNGLFSLAQLQALDGVAPSICLPNTGPGTGAACQPTVPGNVPMAGLRAFDLKLSWVHRFTEHLTVEPSVAFFNLFNFANFDLPQATLNPLLTGAAGSVNGTTQKDQPGCDPVNAPQLCTGRTDRVGVGTGVYSLGAPRVLEWGLKLTF
jgi:carboxypeptidase family protein